MRGVRRLMCQEVFEGSLIRGSLVAGVIAFRLCATKVNAISIAIFALRRHVYPILFVLRDGGEPEMIGPAPWGI